MRCDGGHYSSSTQIRKDGRAGAEMKWNEPTEERRTNQAWSCSGEGKLKREEAETKRRGERTELNMTLAPGEQFCAGGGDGGSSSDAAMVFLLTLLALSS